MRKHNKSSINRIILVVASESVPPSYTKPFNTISLQSEPQKMVRSRSLSTAISSAIWSKRDAVTGSRSDEISMTVALITRGYNISVRRWAIRIASVCRKTYNFPDTDYGCDKAQLESTCVPWPYSQKLRRNVRCALRPKNFENSMFNFWSVIIMWSLYSGLSWF